MNHPTALFGYRTAIRPPMAAQAKANRATDPRTYPASGAGVDRLASTMPIATMARMVATPHTARATRRASRGRAGAEYGDTTIDVPTTIGELYVTNASVRTAAP